jgi:hypothetical protein
MPPPPPQETSPPPPVTTSAGATATTAGRPTGVTIIAVLAAIFGVLGTLVGVLALLGGAAAGAATGDAALGGLVAVFGAILLVVSIAYLVFAWGAWGLKPWAWTLGIGLAAVSIVLGLFSLISGDWSAIINIAIAGAITYYLFRPEVQTAFGRS